MSEPNGLRLRWATLAALGTVAAAAIAFGGGWLSAVKTDAAFRQRTETHLEESKDYGERIGELRTSIAVNGQQLKTLAVQVDSLIESQRRLTDKIDLLVQTQMRDGAIRR